MFSKRHDLYWQKTLECARTANTSPVPQFPLTAGSFARLLWKDGFGTGGDLDAEIRAMSFALKNVSHQGTVFPVVPIYATSICSEHCLYCNFRAGNKGVGVERKRLSLEEVEKEALFLIEEKGLRALELVYASDPLVRVDTMCRHIEALERVLAQHGGGLVGISAEALEEDEYRQLVAAGLSFSVLWQETYDKARYVDLHPYKTRKANFEYRVDAYERMHAAGIQHIGMGVLSGLADWRQDWAMLVQHEAYLQQTCGRGAAILGIPRLKPAPGAILKESMSTPNSQELLMLVGLHNLFSPSTAAFVSTREEWKMCVALAQGGGCLFTLNCSTIPGGYTLHRGGSQFPAYSYDAAQYSKQLQQQGLEPAFEWEFSGCGGPTRKASSIDADTCSNSNSRKSCTQ